MFGASSNDDAQRTHNDDEEYDDDEDADDPRVRAKRIAAEVRQRPFYYLLLSFSVHCDSFFSLLNFAFMTTTTL